MNRINEIDNTIEGKETKTYYQDHPELVVLSGRLYGKVTYAEYFDAYYLQFGDNVYYFPQKDSYQEGRNWKKKKFDSYEECLYFSQQHNIKIVMKSTVKSPFSNGLPDSRFLFPKRNTPYNPSERTDVSRIQENKQYKNTNTTMKQKQTIKLNESQLCGLIKESIKKVLNENERDIDDDTYFGGGLPDSYYQDPADEQPDVYDDDEPSIPEDIADFIYERLKNLPDNVDRFDAKNLNALDNCLANVHRVLRNNVGVEDSIKYIREYVKYYLPNYETAYVHLRHVVEEAKWLFNE